MSHAGSRRQVTRLASDKYLDRRTESSTRPSAGQASPSIISAGKTATLPPEKRLANAVALIDTANSETMPARSAWSSLNSSSSKDPKLEAGLHRARAHRHRHSLGRRKACTRGRRLLGYCFADQSRQRKREDSAWLRLRASAKICAVGSTVRRRHAAASNPRNLWLWTNWGELLDHAGQTGRSHRQVPPGALPAPDDPRYIRPRPSPASYVRLLDILKQRQDLGVHGGAVSAEVRRIRPWPAAIAWTMRDSCCRCVAIPRRRSSSPVMRTSRIVTIPNPARSLASQAT